MHVNPKAKGQTPSLAPTVQTHGGHKRARVVTKTGGLGSRLRSTFQSLRISSSSNAPPPAASITKPWIVGVDGTGASSGIFDEESLSNGALPPTPPQSRRSTRKAAASVLQSSTGTFRRLRAGTFSSKHMSYPPAVGDPSIYDMFSLDDFVLVTPDMYPAVPPSPQNASTPDVRSLRSSSSGTGNRAVTPRRNHPLGSRHSASKAHALMQTPKANGTSVVSSLAATAVQNSTRYADSTDSLVSVSTPPLSACSSVASLPQPPISAASIAAAAAAAAAKIQASGQPRYAVPQPQQWSRNNLHIGIPGASTRPPLPPHAHIIAPAANGTGRYGSSRKISECSFSSIDDQGSLPRLAEPEDTPSNAVPRPNGGASKSLERRRRSAGLRPHRAHMHMQLSPSASHRDKSHGQHGSTPGSNDSSNQNRHSRRSSGSTGQAAEFPLGHGSPGAFGFHAGECPVEVYWRQRDAEHAASGEGGGYDEEERLRAATFPGRLSPRFEFQVDVESGLLFDMSRQQMQPTGTVLTRRSSASSDMIRSIQQASFSIEIQSMAPPILDPRSPALGASPARSLRLPFSSSFSVRSHGSTDSQADNAREDVADDRNVPDLPSPPFIAEYVDFDGSTLTQPTDWLLMSGSGSDGERPAMPTRRRRRRTVLPPSMFQPACEADRILDLVASASFYRNSNSVETLLPGAEEKAAAAQKIAITTAVEFAGKAACTDTESEHPASVSAGAGADTASLAADATQTENVPLYPTAQQYEKLAALVPRVPASIQMSMPIGQMTGLSLRCQGDSSSWQTSRIPGGSMALITCIEHASSLQRLELVNLGLVAILPAILQCKDLRSLDMSHNWISAVPGWLSRLPRLSRIILADNQLSTVSADLVEMRDRLTTLNLGTKRGWSLLSRKETITPAARGSARRQQQQQQQLCRRIEETAAKRIAEYLSSTRLSLTPRQHEASLGRATKLLALYANTMYSTLREPRTWGHS
ncbi:hypothetical protein GGI12_003185, partial [Dipsacomyces acuminosporus]